MEVGRFFLYICYYNSTGGPGTMDQKIRTIIIGVTGMPGSGKGELSNFASAHGISVRSMGDVVRKFFAGSLPGEDPSQTGRFANEERNRHGKDIWAKRLVEEIDSIISQGEDIVIIDGIRSDSEVSIFKEQWGRSLKILCVHSSPETRFRRLTSRGRGDDPDSFEMFSERDQRELGWGLGDVIARADIMLINEEGVKELHQKISQILKELQK
jgi:dephospho-CoA kinase